jgi:hypothetical protein
MIFVSFRYPGSALLLQPMLRFTLIQRTDNDDGLAQDRYTNLGDDTLSSTHDRDNPLIVL